MPYEAMTSNADCSRGRRSTGNGAREWRPGACGIRPTDSFDSGAASSALGECWRRAHARGPRPRPHSLGLWRACSQRWKN